MEIVESKKGNVCFIELKNNMGLEITLCSFGASIYDIKTIDLNHQLESVVVTPSDLNDFYYSTGYYGKSIGRYSGRIDEAKCRIHGIEYTLEKNWNGINALHGGSKGISFQNFDYEIHDLLDKIEIVFSSIEKENDLPGDVTYQITYQILKDKNEVHLIFDADCTKDTLVNLTNHVYFNLSGNAKRTILDQRLQLFCNQYTKLNQNLITESIEQVNPVMDFRNMHAIQDYIYDDSLQNHPANGYDHCWIKEDKSKSLVAILYDAKSHRRLTVRSSYPAIVCYAGCYPEKFLFTEKKIPIEKYHSICLECQFIPNGINMENVDQAILKKGEHFHQYIQYQFDLGEE